MATAAKRAWGLFVFILWRRSSLSSPRARPQTCCAEDGLPTSISRTRSAPRAAARFDGRGTGLFLKHRSL